jgi:hypothetical protein
MVKGGSSLENESIFEPRFVEDLRNQREKVIFLGHVQRIPETLPVDDLKLCPIQ